MIKNNKGFMLVEVIVTSTIVLISMITLYTSFNKLYNNYKIKKSYYNIDAIYATKNTINNMINISKENTDNINIFINNYLPNQSYGYIINASTCENSDSSKSNCPALQSLYNIKNMILVEYDPVSLDNLKSENLNETFKEYIDYLKKYYDIKKNDQYNYIVLTEIQNNDNYYYANLRMR